MIRTAKIAGQCLSFRYSFISLYWFSSTTFSWKLTEVAPKNQSGIKTKGWKKRLRWKWGEREREWGNFSLLSRAQVRDGIGVMGFRKRSLWVTAFRVTCTLAFGVPALQWVVCQSEVQVVAGWWQEKGEEAGGWKLWDCGSAFPSSLHYLGLPCASLPFWELIESCMYQDSPWKKR